MNQINNNLNIGSLLTSLLFGVIGGVTAYQYLDFPLTYTDFIASSITWADEGKSNDVSMIFSFIFVTAASLLVLNKFQEWISRKYDGILSLYFSTVLTYAAIPFVIWIGAQVLNKGIPNYELLYFNAWIVFGGLIATFITLKHNHSTNTKENISLLITFSFIIFFFSSVSFNVLSVILMKAGIATHIKYAWPIIPSLWLIGLLFSGNIIRFYNFSAIVFQLVIIGYFCLLLPSPFIAAGTLTRFPINISLYLTVITLIILSGYDIYRRAAIHIYKQELSMSILSPFASAALLILIFLSATLMPIVNTDDYHDGEKLLPFFMISKYHVIPYVEYSLAHGFIDMLPAIGGNLFLDGTASTLDEGNRILTALIVIASFLIAYRYVGILIAFLLSILIIPIGIWYFIAIVASLIVMKINAEKLGVSFFLISLTTFLLAPGQGAVFIIALLPLVIYRAWTSKTISLNMKSTSISFGILFILSLLMPWILDMFVAAVRYVLENSPIVFQAYGVAWHHSWNSSRTLNSSLEIYEIVRTSWAFVPIFILVFWLLGYYRPRERKDAFLYGLFAVIFILIIHKYALGRIDPFGLSRLGIISKFAIPLLFLSVYFLNLPKEKFAHWSIFFVLWLGFLTPEYLLSPVAHAKLVIPSIGSLTKGEEIGFPNLGDGTTNAAHIHRIQSIKKIADLFLNKDETFVDITNRGGLYFYLDRRMPIEAVPYNLPSSIMQQRSIDRLSNNPPPMALLKADNINHDGRSVSVRAHRLYRWVMDNYIPVAIDDIIIGVHKGKINQFQRRVIEKNNILRKQAFAQNAGMSDISDKNWTKGISNKFAGFVVKNTAYNKNTFKVSNKVEFANGETRIINNINTSNEHLNIYLNGEPLDGNAVGYPNKLKVGNSNSKIEFPNTHQDQLDLWDNVFLLNDLDKLPIAWGNSKSTLDEKMVPVKSISTLPTALHQVSVIGNEIFQILGKDPFVVYDLSKYNLAGNDVGLLSFDFTCDNNNKPELEVFWSADSYPITDNTVVRFNAHNGHVIVPLDAMPRWLTAKHLKTLRFDVANQNDCKIFTLKNITLNQRAANVQ